MVSHDGVVAGKRGMDGGADRHRFRGGAAEWRREVDN